MTRGEQDDAIGNRQPYVEINHEPRIAIVGGREVALTAAELRLLERLLEEPGRALKREQLVDAVTGGDAMVQQRTVDVHICALRRKLGAPDLIETVRRVGYRCHMRRSVKH